MLGPILLSIHNVTYYQRLTTAARAAIEVGKYQEFYDRSTAVWRKQLAAKSDGNAAEAETLP